MSFVKASKEVLYFRNRFLYYKGIDPNECKILDVSGDIWEICVRRVWKPVTTSITVHDENNHIRLIVPDFEKGPEENLYLKKNGEKFFSDFNRRDIELVDELKEYWEWNVMLPDSKRFMKV